MDTNEGLATGERRRRRRHSAQFKADAVAACTRVGVSIASVALAHGVNANLLRRWVLAAEADAVQERPASFVQLQVEQPRAASPEVPAPTKDIRIELRRGATTINVAWPLSESAACAAWMRELLR